jgi:hypothetical protein
MSRSLTTDGCPLSLPDGSKRCQTRLLNLAPLLSGIPAYPLDILFNALPSRHAECCMCHTTFIQRVLKFESRFLPDGAGTRERGVKRTTADEIRRLLSEAGFIENSPLSTPGPNHRILSKSNATIGLHTIWARRHGAIWWGPVKRPEDGERLETVARAARDTLYVFVGPTPSTKPLTRVAPRLIWWTRNSSLDRHHFIPWTRYKPSRFEAPRSNYRYAVGTIHDEPFYKWENVILAGHAPDGVSRYTSNLARFTLFDDGKRFSVKPLFFHRSGPLELMWFSNATPVWRREFDLATRHREHACFLKPARLGSIQVQDGEKLVAILLRADFGLRATWEAGWEKLRAMIP